MSVATDVCVTESCSKLKAVCFSSSCGGVFSFSHAANAIIAAAKIDSLLIAFILIILITLICFKVISVQI